MITRPSLASLRQLRLREHQLFLALSIVVGMLAGLSAVLFTVAIDWTTHLFFGLDPSSVRLFLVPVTVSLATGFLIVKVFPDVRGSGVPQTEDGGAVARWRHSGPRAARQVPHWRVVRRLGALDGSRGAFGSNRRGPGVVRRAVAAAVAGPVRDLVPVGAAGRSPRHSTRRSPRCCSPSRRSSATSTRRCSGPTVVASVASVVVERSILGNEPLFRVPAYHLEHPAELLAYAAWGSSAGSYRCCLRAACWDSADGFSACREGTRPYQPAIGGAVIGLVIIAVPAVMGVGYEYVDRALNGGIVLPTLVLLCALKLVATIVSYSSGNAGGIFAPSLYIGAMAGGAIGTLVHRWAPFPTAEPGAYALVGMGALFAGIIRAPMTSVFMIFEITQDYQILVPLMVANLLSFVISRRFQPEPIYHALLTQDGIHLPSPLTPSPFAADDAESTAGVTARSTTS